MAYELLSPTTRKFRKSVLTFSTAYILLNEYDIELKTLPIGTTSYHFSEEILPVIILVGMFYTAISFVVYALDDWQNKEDRKLVKETKFLIKIITPRLTILFRNMEKAGQFMIKIHSSMKLQ